MCVCIELVTPVVGGGLYGIHVHDCLLLAMVCNIVPILSECVCVCVCACVVCEGESKFLNHCVLFM